MTFDLLWNWTENVVTATGRRNAVVLYSAGGGMFLILSDLEYTFPSGRRICWQQRFFRRFFCVSSPCTLFFTRVRARMSSLSK